MKQAGAGTNNQFVDQRDESQIYQRLSRSFNRDSTDVAQSGAKTGLYSFGWGDYFGTRIPTSFALDRDP